VTISPDGRRVAFVAASPDGVPRLQVRRLDSVTAVALPGTDGATYPFWSPDSQSIGFFAQGRLKRIHASGGPPQTLSDAVLPRGGSWNRMGVILFAANGGARLYRISASGGPATPLSFSRPNRESHWPVFLPDGDRFLYFGRREAPGIYVASLGSGHIKLLIAGQYVAADYALPGHLMIFKGGAMSGTLTAQPFDAGRLEFTGEPIAFAEQVAFYPFPGRADFSVSQTGTLIYAAPRREASQLAWFDRQGNKQAAIPGGVGYASPSLSPDGRTVAAQRLDRETQSQDLWMIDTTRGTETRLTSHPALDGGALWSPDGRRIVFGSSRDDSRTWFQISSSGAGPEAPWFRFDASMPLQKQATQWSRDGRFIVYGGLDPKMKWDIWALPAAGVPLSGGPQPVPYLRTPFNEHHGQLSPDGRWMAYASDESEEWEVYVGTFPASDARWRISTSGGVEPRWRDDGRELFYLATDGTLMTVKVNGGTTFAPGQPKPLFRIPVTSFRDRGWNPHYVPSRDGQRVLVNVIEEVERTVPSVILNWPAAFRR
jgi:eukaryotic-like serine/threonine-protein kinase